MIIPVRCFSCGRVIGSDYMSFKNKISLIQETENRDPTADEIKAVLDELNIKRHCCRRMILSHVDLLDDVLPFD